MSASGRIAAIEGVMHDLRARREEVVNALMWEICKTAKDAATEFGACLLMMMLLLLLLIACMALCFAPPSFVHAFMELVR